MPDPQIKEHWRIETGSAPLFSDTADIYMVVEPDLWPNWQIRLYQEVSEPFFCHLFEKTQFAGIEQGPVLVALNEQSLFNIALNKMENTPCGCLLYFSKDIPRNELISLLRERFLVTTEKSTALLRYYEPRTLLPLLAAMSDEERSLFFHNVTQVHWYQSKWLLAPIEEPTTPSNKYQWAITPEHISAMETTLKEYSGTA